MINEQDAHMRQFLAQFFHHIVDIRRVRICHGNYLTRLRVREQAPAATEKLVRCGSSYALITISAFCA
jgi:hypothetical protein